MTPTPPNSPVRWLRKNLFNTWSNSLLTIVCLWILVQVALGLGQWVSRARWIVVTANLRLFFIGRYPITQSWRVWAVLGLAIGLLALWIASLVSKNQSVRSRLNLALLCLLPMSVCLASWAIGGGLGLASVSSNLWGGLLLTLVVAMTSIVLAFPIGVLLALGRQSDLPVLRIVSTLYIELVRGLPLIGILFMAQVMLPLVLPTEWRWDRLARAIAGLVLFNSAYLAETVRGGLQAIPRGQTEAAKALGLNPVLTLLLIVLPQALRTVTPAIVGQFISLFKDTSLLSLFALLELTGVSRSILAQPQFLGRYAEVYLFIGILYWVFCYGMSQVSRRLERV